MLHAHGALYSQNFGFNEKFEALVARIIGEFLTDHDPRREAAWVAVCGDEPVGSVMCTMRDRGHAQLRLLLVSPEAQGAGLGSRLIKECLAFAAGAGYQAIELWTSDVLIAARHLYERHGFQLVESLPDESFGPSMAMETWMRALP